MATKYISPPSKCDSCGKKFDKVMYDAKTVGGPWGNLCEFCFSRIGVGLGTGRGQKYELNTDGDFIKTEG